MRIFGLDLLRIFAIIIITTIHFWCYSDLGRNVDFLPTYNRIFLYIFKTLSFSFTDLFVLISGYFLCDKNFSYRRIVSLVMQVYFTSLVVSVLVLIIDSQSWDINSIIKGFLPISTANYWFINTYILLCLFIPFINKFISTLHHNEFKNLVIVYVVVNTILMTANPLTNSEYFIAKYSTYSWFIFMYLIGAYLKNYPPPQPTLFNKIKWSVVALMTFLLMFLYCNLKITPVLYMNLFSETGIVTLVFAVSLFQICSMIESNQQHKIVGIASASSLMVYIIQENALFRYKFWGLVDSYQYAYSYKLILVWGVVILVLFVLAICIHLIYNYLYRSCFHKIEDTIFNVLCKIANFLIR